MSKQSAASRSQSVATKDHLPHLVTEVPGPKAREVLDLDARFISRSYTRTYPLVADHGLGAMLWDPDGNRFLDFNAGIAVCATGHCHPKVVAAVQAQAANLIHMSGTDFYYAVQSQAARDIARIVPIEGEKRVFLSNSGTEAVECAIKLARYKTGRSHLISFFGGFHGRTMGSLALTHSKPIHRARFGPFISDVTAVPYAYCYRCPVHATYPGCGIACLDPLEKQVFGRRVDPSEVAAIVVEPMQGEGGYVLPPAEFLARLREITRRHGILLVFDEIQSGMGRTGKMWASEHAAVTGDIYCIAKGVASGMPLGATVASAEVMDWPSGAHANTFGGNPLSCVAAIETIALIKGGLLENARAMGEHLLARLAAWRTRYACVGDIRGKGLMVGVEIVRPASSLPTPAASGSPPPPDPDPTLRDRIVQECFRRGLLILGCGANTLRLSPPLIISREQIDGAVDIMEEVLDAIAR